MQRGHRNPGSMLRDAAGVWSFLLRDQRLPGHRAPPAGVASSSTNSTSPTTSSKAAALAGSPHATAETSSSAAHPPTRIYRVAGLDVLVQHRDAEHTDITLRGEMDLANRAALDAVLTDLLDRRHVRLDLSGLMFLDCSALGALVTLRHQLRGNDATLTLTAASPAVRRLIRLTRLEKAMPTADSPV